jgi:uncharacterized protein YjbJ (UPF0337 family)
MTNQRSRGAVNTVRGRFEQAVGWLTGNRRQEMTGKVHEAQGSAQHSLGDLQDAVRKDRATGSNDVTT